MTDNRHDDDRLEDDDDEWEEDDDDPNDPSHPDYDLSHAGIGVHDEYDKPPWFLRRGFMITISVLVLLGLLLPLFRVF